MSSKKTDAKESRTAEDVIKELQEKLQKHNNFNKECETHRTNLIVSQQNALSQLQQAFDLKVQLDEAIISDLRRQLADKPKDEEEEKKN